MFVCFGVLTSGCGDYEIFWSWTVCEKWCVVGSFC